MLSIGLEMMLLWRFRRKEKGREISKHYYIHRTRIWAFLMERDI